MLKLKEGVIIDGLKPEMYGACFLADQAFADEGLDCIITAALDGKHDPGSLHSSGYAVDIRNGDLDPGQHDRILVKLTRLNRYGFDVVDEKPNQFLATTARHYHVEFQLKPGEQFWHILTT